MNVQPTLLVIIKPLRNTGVSHHPSVKRLKERYATEQRLKGTWIAATISLSCAFSGGEADSNSM